MTLEREFILLLSADAEFAGKILGREAHVQSCLAMAIEEARTRIEAGFHGNVMHMLDAAGDLDILAVGRDALSRLVNGLQAGAAVAIDRDAAHLDGQAANQGRHASHVVALLAFLFHAAPVDVFHHRTRNLDTLQERLHEIAREVVSADVPVISLFGVRSANGSADSIDDNGVSHGVAPCSVWHLAAELAPRGAIPAAK